MIFITKPFGKVEPAHARKSLTRLILLGFITVALTSGTSRSDGVYSRVAKNIEALVKEFDQIPEERKIALSKLSVFIQSKVKAGETAAVTFICTHNSRRSHISQIWAQTAAAYYGVKNVIAYSGGTEATAFNPRAVKVMQELGFRITKTSEGSNPLYEVRYADNATPVKAFSKKFNNEANPRSGFAAVMTCSQADEACPFVPGAGIRISIPYEDPKAFDGTPEEGEKYRERAREIGREILYVFSLIK